MKFKLNPDGKIFEADSKEAAFEKVLDWNGCSLECLDKIDYEKIDGDSQREIITWYSETIRGIEDVPGEDIMLYFELNEKVCPMEEKK